MMIAIRAIFDGRAFVPEEPVSLPAQSEALVIVDQGDAKSQAVEAAVRAYYEQLQGADADDDAWGKATGSQSHRAWDED